MSDDVYFDGDTYDPDEDKERLKGQLRRVMRVMLDGQWHTLAYLAEAADGSEASVSARLRDLRKDRFGGWTVDRQRVEGGLYAYRLAVSK